MRRSIKLNSSDGVPAHKKVVEEVVERRQVKDNDVLMLTLNGSHFSAGSG